MLTALDNNSNPKLQQVDNENGKSSWKLQWSKRSQTFIVKKQCVSKDYSFRKGLMLCTWSNLNSASKGKVLTI